MGLKEIWWHSVKWHILAHDTDEWRILYTPCTVLNPRAQQKAEKNIEWFSKCYITENSVSLAEVVRYS